MDAGPVAPISTIRTDIPLELCAPFKSKTQTIAEALETVSTINARLTAQVLLLVVS